VSWYVYPFNGTYCASKHAALALTDAVRIELKAQGTQVVGVYAGFIDTDMAAGIDRPKTSPQQVAERTLQGVVAGADHVHADTRAEELWRELKTDQGQIAQRSQELWDAASAKRSLASSH
jgi:NAD(P)-dependent dehydrogenase (short-subunit alcohol dehydrogenase family)